MAFLNEESLLWTFSTIAQALAALVALSAMVAFYVLGRNRALDRSVRDQLIKLSEGLPPAMAAADKTAARRAIESPLASTAELQGAVKGILRYEASSFKQAQYKRAMEDIKRADGNTRLVQRGLKLWVTCGAVTIYLSLLALPFLSLTGVSCGWQVVFFIWLILVLLATLTTILAVAVEFFLWIQQDQQTAEQVKGNATGEAETPD